jgi:dolichol-phosphate mannosyltransferase
VARGVSVVTATYCERENIRPLVERVRGALEGFEHEVIVVDDTSPDGTYEEAARWADRVILMRGAGQTRCLLEGIRAARYPVVVTLDADLENPPELIPALLEAFEGRGADLLVASRTVIPRASERFASATLGRIVGVRDVFSNFRVYRRDLFAGYRLRLGETFGGELLAHAWLSGFRIAEYLYEPPPRRAKPRIGGTLKANARIAKATLKLLAWIAANRLLAREGGKKSLVGSGARPV